MRVRISRRELILSKFNNWLKAYLGRKSKYFLENGYPQILTWQFDHISNVIAIDGIYEKELLDYTNHFLDKRGLLVGAAVDIGANIGNHSIYFSKYFEKVFSFEPNPLVYKVLELNTQKLPNIHVYNLGLGSESGTAKVVIENKQNMMGGKLNTAIEDISDESELVDIIRLDDITEVNEHKIGLIKIDVEGMEEEVLKGALETIGKHKPIILFEQHKKDFDNDESPVIRLIRSMSYEIHVLIKKPMISAYQNALTRYMRHFKSIFF
jgi:FkbM family methyltransferase